jgi:hypothetical protein
MPAASPSGAVWRGRASGGRCEKARSGTGATRRPSAAGCRLATDSAMTLAADGRAWRGPTLSHRLPPGLKTARIPRGTSRYRFAALPLLLREIDPGRDKTALRQCRASAAAIVLARRLTVGCGLCAGQVWPEHSPPSLGRVITMAFVRQRGTAFWSPSKGSRGLRRDDTRFSVRAGGGPSDQNSQLSGTR